MYSTYFYNQLAVACTTQNNIKVKVVLGVSYRRKLLKLRNETTNRSSIHFASEGTCPCFLRVNIYVYIVLVSTWQTAILSNVTRMYSCSLSLDSSACHQIHELWPYFRLFQNHPCLVILRKSLETKKINVTFRKSRRKGM